MDPTANLREQIALADQIIKSESGNPQWSPAIELAELVLALNDWIAGGGFLPEQWQQERKPS